MRHIQQEQNVSSFSIGGLIKLLFLWLFMLQARLVAAQQVYVVRIDPSSQSHDLFDEVLGVPHLCSSDPAVVDTLLAGDIESEAGGRSLFYPAADGSTKETALSILLLCEPNPNIPSSIKKIVDRFPHLLNYRNKSNNKLSAFEFAAVHGKIGALKVLYKNYSEQIDIDQVIKAFIGAGIKGHRDVIDYLLPQIPLNNTNVRNIVLSVLKLGRGDLLDWYEELGIDTSENVRLAMMAVHDPELQQQAATVLMRRQRVNAWISVSPVMVGSVATVAVLGTAGYFGARSCYRQIKIKQELLNCARKIVDSLNHHCQFKPRLLYQIRLESQDIILNFPVGAEAEEYIACLNKNSATEVKITNLQIIKKLAAVYKIKHKNLSATSENPQQIVLSLAGLRTGCFVESLVAEMQKFFAEKQAALVQKDYQPKGSALPRNENPQNQHAANETKVALAVNFERAKPEEKRKGKTNEQKTKEIKAKIEERREARKKQLPVKRNKSGVSQEIEGQQPAPPGGPVAYHIGSNARFLGGAGRVSDARDGLPEREDEEQPGLPQNLLRYG